MLLGASLTGPEFLGREDRKGVQGTKGQPRVNVEAGTQGHTRLCILAPEHGIWMCLLDFQMLFSLIAAFLQKELRHGYKR